MNDKGTRCIVAAHALIAKDGKYLLTKRSLQNDYVPEKYDLPGGSLKLGETLQEGLVREVKEETGLEIEILDILNIYSNLGSYPKFLVFQTTFFAKWVSGEVKLNPAEHDEYLWLAKEEIVGYDLIAFLKDLTESSKFKNL